MLLLDAFYHTFEVILKKDLCILCFTCVFLNIQVDAMSNVVIFLVALMLHLSDLRSNPLFIELSPLIVFLVFVLTIINGLSHLWSEWFGC